MLPAPSEPCVSRREVLRLIEAGRLLARTREKKLSDDYKVQISGDLGNGMFVLRGDSVADIVLQSQALKENLDAIYENLAVAKQVVMVKEVFNERKGYNKGGSGGSGGGGGSYQKSSAPAAQTTTTPDGGLSCQHGPMKAFDFKGADGKQVKGHNCPLPKGTDGRCKAVMG